MRRRSSAHPSERPARGGSRRLRVLSTETAWDPVSGLKWTRRTTEKISQELQLIGIHISSNTVARLLKSMKFSLRVNYKKLNTGSKITRAIRNQQFGTILKIRKRFKKKGYPAISVDTKKKEQIGLFKNAGTAWRTAPVSVNDHDFRSDAKGMGVPYGIYDTTTNKGTILLGKSHDTPQFALDSIEKWWTSEGRKQYRGIKELLILADAGGSNSYRSRVWKYGIQQKLCNRHGLSVSVSHYPPGASKWNLIEHRYFSQVTKNWEGRPLDSYETTLKYIRTTKTTTGLSSSAYFARKNYPKGIKVADAQMAELNITTDPYLPKWNYTIRPNKM